MVNLKQSDQPMKNQHEKPGQWFWKRGFIEMIILFTILLCSCKNENTSTVKETNANWQLFIDDYWIAKRTELTTSLHQPEKHPNNPLIRADVPWEENPYCFGTVIYDDKESIYKFWYQSYNHAQEVPERTPILYATSTDGSHWVRPNLGVVEFDGSTDNNILLQNYGYHDLYSPGVIKDHSDPNPDQRYKMIWWDFPLGKKGYQDDGMCVAFSPDGIHWTKYAGNPVLHAIKGKKSISDVMSVMQDHNSGKFVAYTKGWADPWPAYRQIVRTESSDFIHWSEPEVVISHKNDLEDPQSYGMTVTQYGNNYIGMIHSYKKPGDETIDVQLTVSHDNKNWSRVAGQETFIPLGDAESWDDGMIFSAPMFNHGDKTLIYYGGWDNSHDSKDPRRSGIGLATLRMNGFVSLDAGAKSGSVTTHAMHNIHGPLLVNVDASVGSLRAELLDAEGTPVSGYTMKECLPVQTDDIAQVVRWRDHTKLPDSEEALRIRFLITGASLYGFYAGPDAVRADLLNEPLSPEKMEIVERGILATGKPGTTRATFTFPSVIELSDGRLLATCRVGLNKDCENETVEIFRSNDGGQSWSEGMAPFKATKVNGIHGSLKNCYLTELEAGHLIAACMWIDRQTYPGEPLFNAKTEGCLPMVILLSDSYDYGETWTALRELTVPGDIGPPSLTGPILKLNDGSLAISIETNKHYMDGTEWLQRVVLFHSPDEGKTWGKPITVSEDPNHRIFYWDLRVGVAPDGRIAAFSWTYDRETQKYLNIQRRISADGGRTWSPLEDMGFTDQPAHPAILPDGRVVLAWVDRFESHSIRARMTSAIDRPFKENTEVIIHTQKAAKSTIDNTGELLDEMNMWSYGLPYSEALSDGSVMVIYYAGTKEAMDIRWVKLRLASPSLQAQ